MNQEQLAERLGISLPALKQYERGISPSKAVYEALAAILPDILPRPSPRCARDSSSGDLIIEVRLSDGKGRAYRVSVTRDK